MIKQNFNIDLVIRAVNAADVINKVSIHPPAIGSEFHTAQLCGAKVTALTYDFGFNITTIHP